MGLPLFPAVGEVFALDHLGDGELGGEADDIFEAELEEPLAVVAELYFV